MASEEKLSSLQGDTSIVLVGNTYRYETLVLKHWIQSTETPVILCFLLR